MKDIVEKYVDLFKVRGVIGERWLNKMAEDIAAYTKELGTTPNTGSPKLPLLEESLNDLSAEFGGEFDSIKFQRGASAMYGYIVRQLRASA